MSGLTTPGADGGAPSRHHRRFDVVAALSIVFVVLIVGGPGISVGGLGWSDAPNHTFDGIFIYELLKQQPEGSWRHWAEQFYLRYPALGIIVYYPPGFAAVEAFIFALAGVSVATARATVLLYAAGAGLLMYALGRRWFDRPTGLVAALILLTCPHGFAWMNDVMLEWPATFWILAAVCAYERDRAGRRAIWSAALGLSVVMAFTTKQTAGFILPVILLHAVSAGEARRYFLRGGFIVSVSLSVLLIGCYLVVAGRFAALPAFLLKPSLDFSGMAGWPVEMLGWPLLPLAILGLGTFVLKSDRGARGLLLLWFVGWTGFSLLIVGKEPRYLFYSIPPLAFAAVRFCLPSERRGASRPLSVPTDAARFILLGLLVVVQVVLGRSGSTGRLPTYAGAVRELVRRPDADLVLVDAVRDGQFILDVYLDDDARDRIVPLRASKVLYARAARERYGYEQFVRSGREIIELLDRYGIRYIVLESRLPDTAYVEADPPPRMMLRELLGTDERFRLVRSWPLACGDRIWDNVELRLYEYPGCPARTSHSIRLSIPGMGREVTIELPPEPPGQSR